MNEQSRCFFVIQSAMGAAVENSKSHSTDRSQCTEQELRYGIPIGRMWALAHKVKPQITGYRVIVAIGRRGLAG